MSPALRFCVTGAAAAMQCGSTHPQIFMSPSPLAPPVISKKLFDREQFDWNLSDFSCMKVEFVKQKNPHFIGPD